MASLESEVEEVRGALERSREEAYDHHNNTLQLQKEIGRLQGMYRIMHLLFVLGFLFLRKL